MRLALTNPLGRSRLGRAALLLGCLLQAALASAAALRVAVISDLNGSYGSTQYEAGVAATIERLVELRPDLVISTGDMVAGQRLHPPLGRAAVEAMWSAVHAQVSEPVREVLDVVKVSQILEIRDSAAKAVKELGSTGSTTTG